MAKDYRCPPRTASRIDRLAWLKETRVMAQNWLQTQPTYRSFQEAIRLISSVGDDEVIPTGCSSVKFGEVRRDLREVAEILSNLKAVATFKTDNKAMYDSAGMLNTLQSAWWYMTRPQEQIKGAIQMAQGMGRGYLVTGWDPDFHGRGRGNVSLDVKGPHQVLPVQVPENGDIQRAYAVHIITEMPIAAAHAKFWPYRNTIVPDRQSPTWLKKGMDRIQKFLSPVLNLFGAGSSGPSADPIFPTVDIIATYVDDPSVNETGQMVVMGEPGTSWEYHVPSMGTEIWSGINDPKTGEKLMRPVTTEEARLYPMRRLMIWCDSELLYDDTARYWHGEVPAVPVDLDKWVWESIGRPMTADAVGFEESATRLMRSIDDSAVTRLSPPLLMAGDAVSEDFGEDFEPRIPGQTIRITSSMSNDPIKPLLPAEFYNVPNYIPDHIRYLEQRIKRVTGVTDANDILKAKQLPSGDTVEKIREMAGPLITGMCNNLEITMDSVGNQWKFLTYQFMTLERRIQILGDDGVTPEDMDYDPATLIPSHLPGENPSIPSEKSTIERAKWYANQTYFFTMPGSMLRIAQTSQWQKFLLLKKSGVEIDPWTMAELFELNNYGPPPKGAKNIMERNVAWARMQAERAQQMQELMGQGQQGPGRPNSNKKPPHTEMKDGGNRITQSTS